MTDEKIDVTLFYCRPCYLHDRATVRYSPETPETPCEHYGDGPDACKRVEWVKRSFICARCNVMNRVAKVVYADDRPETPCPEFPRRHGLSWIETDESRWVLERAGVAA